MIDVKYDFRYESVTVILAAWFAVCSPGGSAHVLLPRIAAGLPPPSCVLLSSCNQQDIQITKHNKPYDEDDQDY